MDRKSEFLIRKIDNKDEIIKKNKKYIRIVYPPISSFLEKAIRSLFVFRDDLPLQQYKNKFIQGVIFGRDFYDPVSQRESKILGLTDEEMKQLRDQALNFCRHVSPSELDYQLLANNLNKFFDFINLINLLPRKNRFSVFSFGCGEAPEVLALQNYLGERLNEFKGFDKNELLINVVRERIGKNISGERQGDLSFVVQDLSEGLPEGNPDLIIIRHPNIFDASDEKCEKPSEVWQRILPQTREKYPNAVVLITTLTEEEAKACCNFFGLNVSSIKINPYSTHFLRYFPNYGFFKLPVAADRYYILFSSN